MAEDDMPINQAPSEGAAVFSFYGRKNNTTNDLVQYAANQVAHAVGFTASDKGKTPYIDANGDYANLAIGGNGSVKTVVSGLPAWLALGTANQLLRVNAGATAVEFASVNPSSMSQISKQTVSSPVASVVFTDIPSTGYSKFILVGVNVVSAQSATSSSMSIQVSTDNGSTFKTTSGDYYNNTSAATHLVQVTIPGATSTFQYGDFTVELTGLGNSARATSGTVIANSYGISSTNIPRRYPESTANNSYVRSAAEEDDAFRLIVSGNNLTAGTIILYGISEV